MKVVGHDLFGSFSIDLNQIEFPVYDYSLTQTQFAHIFYCYNANASLRGSDWPQKHRISKKMVDFCWVPKKYLILIFLLA